MEYVLIIEIKVNTLKNNRQKYPRVCQKLGELARQGRV